MKICCHGQRRFLIYEGKGTGINQSRTSPPGIWNLTVIFFKTRAIYRLLEVFEETFDSFKYYVVRLNVLPEEFLNDIHCSEKKSDGFVYYVLLLLFLQMDFYNLYAL